MMRLDPRLLSYSIAIASTAIALLLSLSLENLITRILGTFFYIAIIVTTWYGGFYPGIVTVVLSTLALKYFLIPPLHQLWITQAENVLRLGIFFLVALTINLLTSNLRNSTQKIIQLNQKLAQENAEQLRMALSAAHMGMWDWDIVKGEIKWSPEHEQLFGLAVGSFDGKYETFEAYVHPDDRQAINQAVQQALQTHSIYQHEYRIIWADGSIHWLEARGHAFYDAVGQPVRMAGTVMAIDQHKQAQAALQQQEATLRLFAQYAPAGIAMFDRDMRYLMASQQWINDYHLDAIASLIGRSHYELFPEIPERWRQIHQRCLAGAIEKCDEDLFVWADGMQQWIRWEVHPWHTPTDEIGGIIIFAEDITERKQIEAALQQSERRYRSLVHASAQIVWRTDANGMATVTPEGWEELTGQPATEQKGWGWLDTVHPDDRDRTAQCWQESFTNRTFYETECRLRSKHGNYRDFAVRGVPILDADGKISEWIGTCTDVTERKLAEAALRESQIQLQQQLAEIEIIYQSAPIGLSILDTDFRFVRINERLAEINGLPVEAHIGRTVREILPELADEIEKLFYTVLETGKPILNVEISGETPAQPSVQRTWLESWLPLKDGERIIGISVVCEEITERKRIEAERQQAKEELELRVAERTAELSQLNANLQQSESTLRSFFNSGAMLMGIIELHNQDILHISDNRAAAQFFGTTPEAMQNRFASDLGVPQLTIQEWLSHYHQAQQIHAPIQFEYRHDTPNGQRWLSATVSPIEAIPNGYSRFSYIVEDITERKQAKEQIEASLQEKEVLIKEIHHRVKNNLAIVSSLLKMQSRRTQDTQANHILCDSQNRIASIALVHETLYSSEDLANIDFAQYIAKLTTHLFASYNISYQQIELSIQIEHVDLDIETAVPCGLIINELVSNALKYAFPDNCTGKILVKFYPENQQNLILIIHDNGIGLPANFDSKKSKTLGINLVQGLVKQLRGTIEMNCQQGTEFKIYFPQSKICKTYALTSTTKSE